MVVDIEMLSGIARKAKYLVAGMPDMRLLGVLAAWCLLAAIPMHADEAIVAELRTVLLNREARVNSFRAEYTLYQRGLDPESGANWDNMKCSLVFRGPDVRRVRTKSGTGTTYYDCRLNGIRKSLTMGSDKQPVGVRVSRDSSVFPLPFPGSIGPRMAMFGFVHGEPLGRRFATGTLIAGTVEGHRRLTWLGPPNARPDRIDFHFDSANRLTRLDAGLAATGARYPSLGTAIARLGPDRFFEIGWTLQMTDFVEVGGIPVPRHARRVYWEAVDENLKIAEMRRLAQRGLVTMPSQTLESTTRRILDDIRLLTAGGLADGLSPTQRRQFLKMHRFLQVGKRNPASVLRMEIDTDSVTINPRLSGDDIDVDVPEGTRVVGDASLLNEPVK